MKFIVSKLVLSEALGITGKAVSPNNVVPLLANYLFQVKNNKLSITGSNLQIFITKTVAVEAKDVDVVLAIPAARLYNLVKELDEQPVVFLIEQIGTAYKVTIQAIEGTYVLTAEAGKDYPELKTDKDVAFLIEAQDLFAGVNKTLFACSGDELRPAMTGVLISCKKDLVTYTATNAAMLSTFSYRVDVEADCSFIVPAKILSILQTLAAGKLIEIELDKKGIIFNVDESTVIKSRLIDEKYPDYQSAIPKNNSNKFTASKVALMSSLRRITQFAEGNNHRVILEVDEYKCSLKTENSLGETAFEQIKHGYAGVPLTIGIDGKNLLNCLGKMETEMVSMSFSAANRAILLRELGFDEYDDTNLMLLMPLTI